nr:MAG TPA: Terminase [Bacteriophage sp.]
MASFELMSAVQEYEEYIKTNGINERVIDAYCEAVKTAVVNEKDIEYGLKISKRCKEIIETFCITTSGGTIWDLEKYSFKEKVSYEIIEKFYSVLLIEAQNKVVDSFFRYIEHKREPKERFYMPRRKQFLKIGLMDALQGMIDDRYDILCISLIPGAGKAGKMSSKVLTPSGFIEMRDVKVGTKVVAGNGEKASVIGVYPQGKRRIYRITMNDGGFTEVSDNHLWEVQNRCDRQFETRTGEHRTRIVKTEDMLNDFILEKDGRKNYSIDYVPKIKAFTEKKFYIHPYLLGCLLGDGGLSTKTICFTKKDKEIVDKINSFIDGYEFVLKRGSDKDYYLHSKDSLKKPNLLMKELDRLGLLGTKSATKFIPKEYLYSSHEQRLWLLRGLLDTDGYAEHKGIEYSTSSEKLAKNVVELVRSLGGYASLTKRKAGYRDKNGKYVPCLDNYRITILFSANHENPFWLERKAKIYKPKRKIWKRYIKNIEYVGEEECQCIMIDNPCHLYITDDYIITHNTTIEKFFNAAVIGWFPKDFNLFYSHSGDITRMYYDGVYDIVTNADDYAWNEIFPNLHVTGTNAKTEQFNVGKYKPFPSVQCTSVGSKNAGKVRASKFLLVDDMIGGIEEAMNPVILDKLWNKYAVDARQRKIQDSEGKNCKEIHIATRWSVHDVIGRIQNMYEGNPRVKTIAVPDIDPITQESNFDYEFSGFTKEFFEDQQLLMDDISYRCLYKQEPIEREGLVFPEDKIRRYLNLPHGEPEIITAQCDTKGKGTDYFVLPIMQKYGDDYYCVDCVCDNTADYEMQYENAANALVNNKVQECEFERNAGGDRVAMEVNKRVEAKGWICNITDTPTETNKEARIFQCSNWILQHVIFKDESMYSPKEPYGVMMSLLKRYSVSGKKQLDDVPDVFSNFAVRITKGNRIAKVEATRNPFRGGVYY